jgi:Cu/Ag efflux protein CusF
MNRLRTKCAAAMVCVMCSLQAGAADMQPTQTGERELPGVMIGGGITQTATVEAVNADTREITLREPGGEPFTIVASDEVRNFAQIEVGDRVTVQHEIGLVMVLSPTAGGVPERVDQMEVARAPAGEKPGGIMRKTVQATATVLAVDLQARTVTLKGPRRTVSLPVAEDIDLESVKVGDQVNAMYRETIAISVAPAK